ncbi:hypothetical protein J4480_04630 [Candidatus Woesearchaeota archaeon]|nr:hypothetical protein [Candidatus Woesearchaeota archaeon]
MKFSNIIIEDKIKEKILTKHRVEAEEIKRVLLSNPLVLRAKYERYMAIGKDEIYLTIIFESKKDITSIITAYHSSEAQIKLYKKKKF